ncbi:unnamed protein product [Ilex paraguariensis]|uniref:Uncharacterized protein n=1 Tax=Ilex paraguariensis TaxID=185542 RepID=A0ABC8UXE4_9AQUA
MPSIQTRDDARFTRRLGNGVLIAPGTKNSSAAAATGEIFEKTGSAIGLGPLPRDETLREFPDEQEGLEDVLPEERNLFERMERTKATKQELRRLIRKRIYILATLNATTSLLSTGMLDREKQAKKQQDTEYEGAGGRANDQLKIFRVKVLYGEELTYEQGDLIKENIRDIKADAMVISSLVAEDNGGFNPTDQP